MDKHFTFDFCKKFIDNISDDSNKITFKIKLKSSTKDVDTGLEYQLRLSEIIKESQDFENYIKQTMKYYYNNYGYYLEFKDNKFDTVPVKDNFKCQSYFDKENEYFYVVISKLN